MTTWVLVSTGTRLTPNGWSLTLKKMLYDQALLTTAYAEAYQATGDESFGAIAKECLEYVLREMTGREGGFFSAQDADTAGEEGGYYL